MSIICVLRSHPPTHVGKIGPLFLVRAGEESVCMVYPCVMYCTDLQALYTSVIFFLFSQYKSRSTDSACRALCIRQNAWHHSRDGRCTAAAGRNYLRGLYLTVSNFRLVRRRYRKVVDAVFATLPHRVIHCHSVDAVDVMVTPCCTQPIRHAFSSNVDLTYFEISMCQSLD